MKTSALISLTLLLPILTVGSSNPTAPAPSPTNTDFIRTSCTVTLYPEICYTSLSGYATSVQNNHSLLARVAIAVSLSHARRVAAFLSNKSDSGTDPRAMSAVHDCRSVFSDAVDNIKDSLGQMCRLGEGGEDVRFQLSNVQTWMSAALTNEDTCTDGFEDVEDGKMKKNVCGRTVRVKKVTSNALALVNSYVSMVTKS